MAMRMFAGMSVAVVLVAGMAMSNAFAHDHEKMMGMMDQMDTNHDGMISAAEHAAHAKMMFDKMDANHDGMISKDEMAAGMKMMHEEREAREPRNEHMKDEMNEKKEHAMDDDRTPPPTK